ncbi:M23 family metallopeptidase [Methylorubrum extorquens]|nr:M23 family metallopeptidase [Methylorubrum extorquens]
MLASPARSTPAVNVDVVLSTLPLPPDVDPPTQASLMEGLPLNKLTLGKPVADGNLRSGFGIRRHPILLSSKMHTGVDWAARLGAPILSAGEGTVILAEWAAGYGRRVEIQHADGVVTAYSHMSRFSTDIEPGAQVRQGQVIGFVGSTGLSTGPHLHFEVLVNGYFVDPMDIYAPGGGRVAARVQKKASPTNGRTDTAPAEQIAALAASAAPLAQPARKPVRLAERTTTRRIAAASLKPAEKWAEHDQRMRAIQSKITASTLMIMR